MNKKAKRYERIISQLNELYSKTENRESRLATAIAVLHHKMKDFFWTGYYRLVNGELLVGAYQGSLACLKLAKDTGVCWASINQKEPIIVVDVESFPGHIACDSRSKSEICIPIFDKENNIWGVFDVDSKTTNSFDEIDEEYLSRIIALL